LASFGQNNSRCLALREAEATVDWVRSVKIISRSGKLPLFCKSSARTRDHTQYTV